MASRLRILFWISVTAAAAAGGLVLAALLVASPPPIFVLLGALAALIASAAAAVMAAWLERRLVGALVRLRASVERVAAGQLPEPMEHDAAPELAEVSRGLERLADRMAGEIDSEAGRRRTFEAILAGVPQGVLVTGPQRVPVYANPAFRRLFGLSPEASTGELLELVRRPRLHDAIATAESGRPGGETELQAGSRQLAVEARRLEGLQSTLLVARDVTEASRVARMRRDFVANLSHEIKTPLAVIRGAAETLRETGLEDPEATERFVTRIVEQIYRLEDLLKDLQILSRLESPEASLQRQELDLAVICRRAIELVAPLAETAEVGVRSTISEVPLLEGDPKALERMVLNLLVNGVQYNQPGGHVFLRLAEEGDRIVLEVEDDGIGIPDAEQSRIFERFYRVDKGRGRREGGSGLGLAIVKHVAQFHGGGVEVSSGPGRGSRFRVVLPSRCRATASR